MVSTRTWLRLDSRLISPIGFEDHPIARYLVGKDKLIQLAARTEGIIADTAQSEFRICAGLEKNRAFTLGLNLANTGHAEAFTLQVQVSMVVTGKRLVETIRQLRRSDDGFYGSQMAGCRLFVDLLGTGLGNTRRLRAAVHQLRDKR